MERQEFIRLISICNDKFGTISDGLYLYKEIMKMHWKHNDVKKLLDDKQFLELIYVTLMSWGMNRRAAKLVPFEEFK